MFKSIGNLFHEDHSSDLSPLRNGRSRSSMLDNACQVVKLAGQLIQLRDFPERRDCIQELMKELEIGPLLIDKVDTKKFGSWPTDCLNDSAISSANNDLECGQ